MINEIVDPVMGPLAIPGFPLRFSEQPERLELVDVIAIRVGEAPVWLAVLGRHQPREARHIGARPAGGRLLLPVVVHDARLPLLVHAARRR